MVRVAPSPCKLAGLPCWSKRGPAQQHLSLKWKHMCEFMRLYFVASATRPLIAKRSATELRLDLSSDNLRDGVLMIRHQCEQLFASSEALRNAQAALLASLRASNTIDFRIPSTPDWDGPPMQSIRQQLVTMQRWLVQMHVLYYASIGLCVTQCHSIPTTTCMYRFHMYHTALAPNSLLLSLRPVPSLDTARPL